jgi:hypothetical protein
MPAKTGDETDVPPTMEPKESTAWKMPLTQELVEPLPPGSSDCAVQKMYPGKFGDASRETSGTYRTPAGAFGTDNPS